MLQPVAESNLLLAAVSGALVVLAGAGYALLFSISRVFGKPRLMPWAYGFYCVSAAAVCALAATLRLAGFWWALVALMLAGYLFAPHGIWRLCVAVHEPDETGESR